MGRNELPSTAEQVSAFLDFARYTKRRALAQKQGRSGTHLKAVPITALFSEDGVRDFWDRNTHSYISIETPAALGLTMFALLESIPIPTSPQRWLSLGSGPGFYEIFLAKTQPNLSITSVDLSPKFINMQRKTIEKEAETDPQIRDRITPIVGSMNNLQSGDGNKFDRIFCINAFHWNTDWKRAVTNICQALSGANDSSVFITLGKVPFSSPDGRSLFSAPYLEEVLDEFASKGLGTKTFGRLVMERGQSGEPESRYYAVFQRDPDTNRGDLITRLMQGKTSCIDYQTVGKAIGMQNRSVEVVDRLLKP